MKSSLPETFKVLMQTKQTWLSKIVLNLHKEAVLNLLFFDYIISLSLQTKKRIFGGKICKFFIYVNTNLYMYIQISVATVNVY